MNNILYQIWFCLTLLSAVAATFIGIIILQQKTNSNDTDGNTNFKKAVAFAFFGVSMEVLSRFISLAIHTTTYPTSEIIICCIGRFVEVIGLWGLLLYLTSIWPFNNKN